MGAAQLDSIAGSEAGGQRGVSELSKASLER